jgi:hypothetical protein
MLEKYKDIALLYESQISRVGHVKFEEMAAAFLM